MNTAINYDRVLLSKLKNNYFMAKALYETIKETAEEIEKKVLTEHEFYETNEVAEMMGKRGGSGKPERITRPFDTYLMSDADFKKYLALVYPEYKKAGIANPKGAEWCPDAESKELYYEAMKQLVEFGINIIPTDMEERQTLQKAVQNIKWRDRVLDLVLRLEC